MAGCDQAPICYCHGKAVRPHISLSDVLGAAIVAELPFHTTHDVFQRCFLRFWMVQEICV